MNGRKGQKNDYVFVAHNGSAYDSQFIYKNAHNFFGSRNVQVLMHNHRMIELKIQVNKVLECQPFILRILINSSTTRYVCCPRLLVLVTIFKRVFSS